MKKGILFGLAMVLTVALTGCGTMSTSYPIDGDSYGNVSTSRDGTVNGGMQFHQRNTNAMGAGNHH